MVGSQAWRLLRFHSICIVFLRSAFKYVQTVTMLYLFFYVRLLPVIGNALCYKKNINASKNIAVNLMSFYYILNLCFLNVCEHHVCPYYPWVWGDDSCLYRDVILGLIFLEIIPRILRLVVSNLDVNTMVTTPQAFFLRFHTHSSLNCIIHTYCQKSSFLRHPPPIHQNG